MKYPYKNEILENGLQVVTSNMPSRRSAALGIWIKVGGRYESSPEKGISHVLEHLLFKGSKKYSCYKIKEEIEGVGGSLNGFTSEELTCYLVKMPAEKLSLALDVLADMVVNPLLPELELEKEKTVIIEEIKMYKDLPQSYVYDLLDELLWPGQPLGMPVIGTVDSVNAVTRQSLSNFKEKFYVANNIIISAAGIFQQDELIKQIKKLFKRNKENDIPLFAQVSQKQDNPQLKILDKDTEQTHMALGFHALKRDHHLRHALNMLHIILGGNMSSRLFNEIREKRGLAYEIGTQLKRYKDTGAFVVHAGIDNLKVEEATSLILDELFKTKESLVSPDEFRRAKEFYIGQLMLALEDTLDHMLWIGEQAASSDSIYSLEDIIKQVNSLKREDVRTTAELIFKKELINLSLIGPVKEKEDRIYSNLGTK